jgi:hypothetical protein
VLATGRALAFQATSLERLAAMAVAGAAVKELRFELVDRSPSARTLRALLTALDRHTDWPPLSHALAGERLVMLDTIARTHTDDGNGDGCLILAELERLGAGDPRPLLPGLAERGRAAVWVIRQRPFPTKHQTIAAADRLFESFGRWCEVPPLQRTDSPLHPRHILHEEREKRNLTLGILAPDTRLAQVADLVAMELAGTRLMLAIELFHAERGRYPTALSDLPPDFLVSVPDDPFSADGFRYQRLDAERDPAHRPYLLYSTGFDGRDDGGVPDPNGPAAAAQPGALPGFDCVLNLPGPALPGR